MSVDDAAVGRYECPACRNPIEFSRPSPSRTGLWVRLGLWLVVLVFSIWFIVSVGRATDTPIMGFVRFSLLAVLVVAAYFLPTLIAIRRGHLQSTPIFILNLLLGWTGLGWVGALIWSFIVTRPR
jgi:hypothetical protein